MKKKRVSIVDIANELKITPATVSRALNADPKISIKTREAVVALAKQWRYRPNPFAKSLVYNRTNTIGLIIPEFTHHYFNKILSGIESVTNAQGYQLLICTTDDQHVKEVKSCETLIDARVEGLITTVSSDSTDFAHYHEVKESGIPLVFIDRICEDIDAACVTTNDFQGAFDAVAYLIGQQRRQIVHLKGPREISTAFNRYMGYTEALKKHHIPFSEQRVIDSDNFVLMCQQLSSLLQQQAVDAIFAFNDYTAYEAMQTIRNSGLRIPEDIALIGYADEPIASYINPKLSTVKQPAFELGCEAAMLLIEQMQNEDASPISKTLLTQMILRETTP